MVLTLHLAAFRLPEASTWSVWPYTFLPPWLGWVLALLAGSLIIPAVSQAVLAGLAWLQSRVLGFAPQIRSQQVWFIIITLLSGLLFWIARLRHLSWGDSYLLSIALSYHDLDLRVILQLAGPLYRFSAPAPLAIYRRSDSGLAGRACLRHNQYPERDAVCLHPADLYVALRT